MHVREECRRRRRDVRQGVRDMPPQVQVRLRRQEEQTERNAEQEALREFEICDLASK